jgi:hypothetical protein
MAAQFEPLAQSHDYFSVCCLKQKCFIFIPWLPNIILIDKGGTL